MLTASDREFFEQNGYLHVPNIYSDEEMTQMDEDHSVLTREWAVTDKGWTGDWRNKYMDKEVEEASQLTAMHDLHFYSGAWQKAATHPKLAEVLTDLLGPNVELHHTTMHAKPPGTGQPFPLHQDNAFYEHVDGRYVDVLVHLDDTCHENGEIRFLSGSHKEGYLKHITQCEGVECSPHLPVDQYPLENTVAVPAKRGDVVLFNIFTVHGSYINTTDRVRRLVRMGYRHPANVQLSGQSIGRPGVMICGLRPRLEGSEVLTTEAVG